MTYFISDTIYSRTLEGGGLYCSGCLAVTDLRTVPGLRRGVYWGRSDVTRDMGDMVM